MQPYTITFECDFSEFWRYNLIIQGETLRSGERYQAISHLDKVAPLGSELSQQPADYSRAPKTEIVTESGDGLRLYIYIMPHTMPFTREIAAAAPFEFRVTIETPRGQCFKRLYQVNQWSGCNIEITL